MWHLQHLWLCQPQHPFKFSFFFGLVLMFVQIKPNANKSISNETRSEINVLQNKYDKINVFATERVASNKINWCRRISRMCDVVLIKIHGHESCEASLWNVWKALVAVDVWVYGCACVCVCVSAARLAFQKAYCLFFRFSLVFSHSMLFICVFPALQNSYDLFSFVTQVHFPTDRFCS